MVAIEAVAVVFSLGAVWLTVREKIVCWPVGLVGVVAYGVFFHQLRLYADTALQFVFFGQGVYGWWYWARGGRARSEAEITAIGVRSLSLLLVGLLLAAWLLGQALSSTNAAAPHLDAFLALTSLTANQLLARKVLESWWLWITADFLYIGLFIYKGALLSAALYAVFLVMAISGALRWQAQYRQRESALRLEPA